MTYQRGEEFGEMPYPRDFEIMEQPFTSEIVGHVSQQGGETGEYLTTYSVVEFSRFLTEDEINEYAKDKFPSTRCQHDYDCCGQFYKSKATWTRIQHHGDIDIIVVRQNASQNV